jgi:hypothetical protein
MVRTIGPVLSLAAVLSFGLGLPACGAATTAVARDFTPGQLERGAHVHAYQASGFAHGFMQSHVLQWDNALSAFEEDVPPFFDALRATKTKFDIEVVGTLHKSEGSEYEHYATDLILVPNMKGARRLRIPGAEGTRAADYYTALARAATQTNIPAEVIRRGHFALFAAVRVNGALNATDDSLRRYAFGLLVLREKLRRGETNVDYLAPTRSAEESLEDIELALRVVADHHAETARFRAEILALTALARNADVDAARAALADQIRESRARAEQWQATHPRPTADDFGVRVKELKLPTAEGLLASLDKDGYLTKALEVARGIASGNVSQTVEALGKLAPENSALRVASRGLGAALRGDVAGAANAALELAEKNADVGPTVARLRSIAGAAESARKDAAAAIAQIPKSPDELKARVQTVAEERARGALPGAPPLAVPMKKP